MKENRFEFNFSPSSPGNLLFLPRISRQITQQNQVLRQHGLHLTRLTYEKLNDDECVQCNIHRNETAPFVLFDSKPTVYLLSDSMMFQYYIKIVPTMYVDLYGKTIHTNQFSVTRHSKMVSVQSGESGMPGIFFSYELSPSNTNTRCELEKSRAKYLFNAKKKCGRHKPHTFVITRANHL